MLEEILRDDNLSEALEKLKTKNDSAGIDGMKLSDLEQYLSFNKRELVESIVSKEFSPGIVKEIEILEKGGKRRVISLLNSVDRFILRAIHQVLYKKISPCLSIHSFAYKENTGIPDLMEAVRDYAGTGLKYVIELDIEGYFDNISHKRFQVLVGNILP